MNNAGTATHRKRPADVGDEIALSARTASMPRSGNALVQDDVDDIKAGSLNGLTVLLVEDDAVSRESLELILQYYGARVLSATSVFQAIDLFERNQTGIVVSDIGLPLRDGCSLLRSIRARERLRGSHVPAVAISGFSSGETAERARRAGFDAFLRKPINIRTLLRLICSLTSCH